ncbi:hypothetical protein GE09DRAFT_490590 [Coniochaeta sp. 2T2.1]|nr:hypothetical protein GE09DRAFT_490590 [Coniochaeta sp. 2T2.1]
MVSRILPTLLVLSGLLSLSWAAGGHPSFVGQGYIRVLAGGNISAADANTRIGCMSETGALTYSDCGVFTKHDDNGHITSRLGECTFLDDTQPGNEDSYYGKNRHAWVCRPGVSGEYYYAFDSFKLPIIWHGNLDCYEDTRSIPKPGEKLPIWPFVWGSLETDVPPGHTKTMWMWVPLDNGTTTH